jgi:hypothetical protein
VNSTEAKRILIAHRPGRDSANDPDIVAALEQARRDPALAQWWQQQQAFHASMKKGFGEIPVPEELRGRIRQHAKVVPFPWWQQPQAWAAAAAVVLLIGLAAIFWKSGAPEGTFSTFRSRMVRNVLRQYRMDIQTNDMASIRQFLAAKNAPADYKLSSKLAQLPPMGAGVISWQTSRASMVCLDAGPTGTAFLFVVNRADVKKPPGASPEFAQVNKLMTASWVEGEKVYLLAFPGEAETFKKFFGTTPAPLQ